MIVGLDYKYQNYCWLIGNEGNSYYVYIKDFNRFMHNKTTHKDQIFSA